MRALVTIGLALTLWGCQEPPAAEPELEAPAPEPEPEPEPFVDHEVAAGQTLWDIARAYRVDVDAILEANEMTQRDVRRLSKGRVLRIPGVDGPAEVTRARATRIEDLPPLEDAAYHLLAEGETLWDVAHTYERTAQELIERNQLSDDDVRLLRPGRAIIVPGIAQADIRQVEPAARSRGLRHTVARGETVWDLARSFRVSVSALMAANGLSQQDAAGVREGQRLWIPGAREGEHRSAAPRRLTKRQRSALRRSQRLGLGTRQVAQRLLRGQVERRWVRQAGRRWQRLPGTLRWPVTRGRYVRGFGSGEAGYHLAMDIAGDMGWNVRAAAAGIVGYSGDEVPGFGNIVLLIHPGGWVTLYAHNSVNFVVAGEQVPAGAVLAELGSTGISRGPHVHFELMYDGKNCDPATLFRPGVRHASRLANIPRQTWTRPSERPEGLKCFPRRRHPRSRWIVNE